MNRRRPGPTDPRVGALKNPFASGFRRRRDLEFDCIQSEPSNALRLHFKRVVSYCDFVQNAIVCIEAGDLSAHLFVFPSVASKVDAP